MIAGKKTKHLPKKAIQAAFRNRWVGVLPIDAASPAG
jgi:hypothetical protein